MNRCPLAKKGIVVGFAVWLIAVCWLPAPAKAQSMLRQFPAAARRATLEVTSPPNVLINGQAERLSPGARIKSQSNLLTMSASLVGQQFLVNFLRNAQGQVHEVWLLSPAEAAEKRSGMEPITNFTSGSDADKPKTDDGKTPFDQLPRFQSQ